MAFNFDLYKAYEQAMDVYKEHHITITQPSNEFPYITIKDDPNGNNIKYCAICFGYEGKLVPLMFGERCIICTKRGQ